MGCHNSVHGSAPGGKGFAAKYTLTSTIGMGSFGQVHAALSVGTRRSRAVKVLDLSGDGGGGNSGEGPEKLARLARHEEKIWRLIGRNDYCVELLDSFIENDCCFFVMERCEASVMDRIGEVARLSDWEQACLFREMLLGISHLHSLHIVHRDIKPNNYLLGGCAAPGTAALRGRGRVPAKLCDFGLAAAAPKGGGLLKGCYGTAPYMAPEMVAETGHLFSADLWSFGVSSYVVLYRAFPYTPEEHTSKAMKLAILHGVPEPKFTRAHPRPMSEYAESFVRSMLQREPCQRCTIKQALALPFLSPDAARGKAGKAARAAKGERPKMATASTANMGSFRQGTSDDSTQSGGPDRQSTTSTLDSVSPNPARCGAGADDRQPAAPLRI